MEEPIAPVPPVKSTDLVTWGPWSAVLVTITSFFASQYLAVFLLLIYPIASQWGTERTLDWLQESTIAQFSTLALTYGFLLLMIHWFLKYRHSSFRAVGWNRKPKWLDVGYALAGFGIYFVCLNFIIFPLAKLLIPGLDFNQKQEIGFANVQGPILILVFVALAIVVPIVEETVMRGFLYTGLKSKLRILPAAIITSLLFGVAHLGLGGDSPPLWTAGIDTFALSFVLICLREKTDSLYASVGLHFLKNSLAFLALFVFHLV